MANRSVNSQPGMSENSGNMSPEMERDYLKEKVEHFKVLLKKMQEELQSNRIRKEGAETVSKLLQESKQQVLLLENKNRSYESVIRNLQSRLEQHGLSSDITLQEGEDYIPGHSKQLVDNLTRENTRLRNLIRQNNGDPEELAKLQQYAEELKREINGLQTGNAQLQSRIEELETVLKSSDNEKDKTITQLQKRITLLEQEVTSRNSMCTSLAEERRALQTQLREVAGQCHELAKKLHSEEGATDRKQPMSKQDSGNLDDVVAMRDENKMLSQKVKEITDMNKRWQEYNNQREAYVKQLQHELNEVKVKDSHSNHAREFEDQMNKILDEARRNVTTANNDKEQARRELAISKGTINSLSEQLNQMRRRLEAGESNDNSETIEALKAQVQICTEDFESERRDREKAQTRLIKQELELENMKKELEAFRRAHQQAYQQGLEHPHPQEHGYPYQMPGHYTNYSGELAARGVTRTSDADRYNVIDGNQLQSDGQNTGKNDVTQSVDSFVKVDAKDVNTEDDNYVSLSSISSNSRDVTSLSSRPSPRNSESSSPKNSLSLRSSGERKQNSDVLKCPKCGQQYTADEHYGLLEHMEECCV